MATGDIVGKVKISTRVGIVGLLITAIFVAVTFGWILPTAEDALLDKKKEKLKEETEAAWSILSHFETMARDGRMTTSDAQAAAAAVIGSIRYGPDMKDYFWINNMLPTMIMHPYRQDLVGKDLNTLLDKRGVAFVVDFTKVAREKGEGFTTYWWQWQDDPTKIVEKISYVRLFRPWNWVIGTGMYIEDVRLEIRSWRIRIGMVCLVLALTGIVLSWLMGRDVARSIRAASGQREETGEEDVLRQGGATFRMQSFILAVVVPMLLVTTAVWCAVLYHDLRAIIMDGFDKKLISISGTTGCFIKGEDHAEIARQTNETSELYQKYVMPMKQVARRAHLTYLYTQVLPGEKLKCVYILDATEGKDHSSIGSEDTLPLDDYNGSEKVLLYGIVYVGDVKPTDVWGLLKVSYAPIYNDDDTIAAIAGADVNINIISDKMRAALFAIAVMGVAALLLALYVSAVFSSMLIKPITALREGALIVAAGTYDHKMTVDEPNELKGLSEAFSRIGLNLAATLKEMDVADRDMEQRKTRHDLVIAMDKSGPASMPDSAGNSSFARAGVNAGRKTASGWSGSSRGDLLLWIADRVNDPMEAVKLRNDIAIITERLLEKHCANRQQLLDEIRLLFMEQVRCWFLLPANSDAIEYISRREANVAEMESGTQPRPVAINKDGGITLDGELELVISDDERFVETAFLREALANASASPAEQVVMLVQKIEEHDPDREVMIGIVAGGRRK